MCVCVRVCVCTERELQRVVIFCRFDQVRRSNEKYARVRS